MAKTIDPKKAERADVVIDQIYPEFEQPANWDRPFDWKPNIGIYYSKINQQFQKTGESLFARVTGVKQIWIFEKMGGKLAKGRFFDMMFEYGDHPNPWASFNPVAELFTDGNQRRIVKPEDGQVETPGSTQPPAGSKPAPAAAVKSAPPTNKAVKTDPKYSEKATVFFNELAKPQSDAWWLFKTHLGFDGATATNVMDFAKHMALMENGGAPTADEKLDDWRKKTADSIDYWGLVIHTKLCAMKALNVRERLAHYLTITTCGEDIAAVMSKAWQELPVSDYEMLRVSAEARQAALKDKTAIVAGTLQPEYFKAEAPAGNEASNDPNW